MSACLPLLVVDATFLKVVSSQTLGANFLFSKPIVSMVFRKTKKMTRHIRSELDKMSVPRRVRKLERKVKKIVPPEVKRFVRSDQDVTPNYTGEIFNLSAIAQGTTDSERIGDQVHAAYLNWRSTFTLVDTPANEQNVRVIVFRDINNTITAVNQVLYPSAVGTVGAVNAPYNQQQRGRFVVLYDKSFAMCNYAGGIPNRIVNFKKKLNFPIELNNTDTSIYKNSLKCLLITDIATSAMAHDFYSEILFTDA